MTDPSSDMQPRGGEVMSKVYLYVPFEDRAEVSLLGARWDAALKCWYVDNPNDTRFRKWLGYRETHFAISSDRAFVASTNVRCWRCHAPTNVICIYCEIGEIHGEPYSAFTVSDITAVDARLKTVLEKWPSFRYVVDWSRGERYFVNHCSECEAAQRDYYLHCEPGGAFFMLKGAEPGAITFTPISGRVCLDGDEGFEP
jgi:hypothetical protein